jgi:glycerol-3-phosphate acyltransferase PlsX
LLARIGYVLAKGAFDRLREKMDVRKTNGGVFLGLNGLVVKSHGGTDAEGFAAAVELAYDMARRDLLGRIRRDLELFHRSQPEIAATASMNEATGTARHAG